MSAVVPYTKSHWGDTIRQVGADVRNWRIFKLIFFQYLFNANEFCPLAHGNQLFPQNLHIIMLFL